MAIYRKGTAKLFFDGDPNLKFYLPWGSGRNEGYSNTSITLNNLSKIPERNFEVFKFNGTNSDITVSSGFPSVNPPFSVLFWVRVDNSSGDVSICQLGVSGSDQENKNLILIANFGAEFGFFPYDTVGGGPFRSFGSHLLVRKRQMLFIVITFSGSISNGTAILYINGARTGNVVSGVSIIGNGTGGQSYVGTRRDKPSGYLWLNGVFGEFAYFSRVLSPQEISEYYKWATGNKKIFYLSDLPQTTNFGVLRRRLLLK